MTLDHLTKDEIVNLLNIPHQIYLVDDILKADITAFKSVITFANLNPAGIAQTAVSITLSTKDLYRIAKKITTIIESKKSELNREQQTFLDEIGK